MPNDGVSLWRQITGTLETEIREQRLLPGVRLPTEVALARRFGVNRHTVRRALGALEDTGLVRAERGRGTFVQSGMLDYRLAKRTRFSENIAQAQRQPSGEMIRAGREAARGRIARALGVRSGTPLYVIETLGRADGVPVSIGTNYFPARRFPDMPDRYRESGTITAALRTFDCRDYVRAVTRITARPADVFEAKHLQLGRNQPVLVTESVDTDTNGKAIAFGVSRFAADRVQLVIDNAGGDNSDTVISRP